MASSGAVRAGKAYVELYGKDDGLKSTLKTNEQATSQWGQRIGQIGKSVGSTFARGLSAVGAASKVTMGIAGAAVGGFVFAVKSFAENAERLSRLPKTGISNEDLKQARALKIAMSTLTTSIHVAWAQIGAAVAPIATQVLNFVSKIVQGFSKWAQSNRPLIASIAQIAVKVAAFAGGLFVAVKAIGLIAAGVALIANPIGIVATLLAAGVAAWMAWTTSGQDAAKGISGAIGNAVKWLQEKFGALYKDFQAAWGGIVAAVSKGDLAAAAEMAWLAVKLTFFETVKAIGGNWNKFYETYLKSIALIGDAWDVVFTRLKQGWRSTQNFLAKGIAILIGVVEGKSAAERQQVLDILDQMTTQDNKASEDALHKGINERQKKLSEELAALPASDQARIDTLRKRLNELAAEAKEGAPDKPQFYQPKQFGTAGTFNAASIRSVAGGGGPLDKIEKNTKVAADLLDKISKRKETGPTFAGAAGGF